MIEETTNLQLPYLISSQAQKHITHNEALQRLDAAVQLVIAGSSSTPPANPSEGECYEVLAGAGGAFAGHEGRIAFRQDSDWIFLAPKTGWLGWFKAPGRLKWWDGNSWEDIPVAGTAQCDQVGINTPSDTDNRLAVRSAYSLFTHQGAGHMLKINRATINDTATIQLQTGYSGRCEFSLLGNELLEMRVSPDGAGWKTAMRASMKGYITYPNKPAIRTSYGETNMTPVSGTLTGFGTPTLNQGSFSLGATVPSGKGNYLIVPATGVYAAVLNVSSVAAAMFSVSMVKNGASPILTVRDSDSGSQSYSLSTSGLVYLLEGDTIALLHTGTAELQFGQNKTEISLFML